MELRKWDFEKDQRYIHSFLEGMSLAHKEDIRTEEWFHWKFEKSPYGKAILACAFDNEIVAGCVAYGMGIVRYKGKDWKCALSYETFVNPKYQGHGLFKKLISLAESEMKIEGVQFLYNFPNGNSITGFKHMGWICRNDLRSFKIKICNFIPVLMHPKDLKLSFSPNQPNWPELSSTSLTNIPCEEPVQDTITPCWTVEYLQWRFFSFPNRQYHIIDNEKFFAISMVGCRGRLRSAHILYAISKLSRKMGDAANIVVKTIQKELHVDIIEYNSTIFDNFCNRTWGFFKVPAHGNFCYKVFDDNMDVNELKIVLPSINAHTY